MYFEYKQFQMYCYDQNLYIGIISSVIGFILLLKIDYWDVLSETHLT